MEVGGFSWGSSFQLASSESVCVCVCVSFSTCFVLSFSIYPFHYYYSFQCFWQPLILLLFITTFQKLKTGASISLQLELTPLFALFPFRALTSAGAEHCHLTPKTFWKGEKKERENLHLSPLHSCSFASTQENSNSSPSSIPTYTHTHRGDIKSHDITSR